MTRANAQVAAYLFEVATGQRGDGSAATTAAIFWCKTRLRWKEAVVNEVELRPGELTAAEKSARAVAHSMRCSAPPTPRVWNKPQGRHDDKS